MSQELWDRVEYYRNNNFDAIKWLPSCSYEIDILTLEKSLANIKRINTKINPSWFDFIYHMEGKTPNLIRRKYSENERDIEKNNSLRNASLILRIKIDNESDIKSISQRIYKFLKEIDHHAVIRNIIVNFTSHRNAQFALFDHFQSHRGNKIGYTPIVNSIASIINPFYDISSTIHVDSAITESLDLLNLLGCTTGFKIFPVYDARSENIIDDFRKNIDLFTSKYNIVYDDYSSLRTNSFFFGVTAIGNTVKELPTRYSQVEEGMQILITNRLGNLIPLTLFLLSKIEQKVEKQFEEEGITRERIQGIANETQKKCAIPNFSLGKIISRYLPNFETKINKEDHIFGVLPIRKDGIMAARYLARLINAHIVINDIPLVNEDLSIFATKKNLIDNSTASTAGCHIIIANKHIIQLIANDLRKSGYLPIRIGFIAKLGKPQITFDKNIKKYICSKYKQSILLEN